MQETWVQSLGREDPLEKEVATHSSLLPREIPRAEEPGGYSPWGCKESDMTEHACRELIQAECVYLILSHHSAFPSFENLDLRHTFYIFSMGMVLIPVSCTMSRTSVHSSSGTLSIRSGPLNLFLP